jgi:hypothetical protein
MQQARLSGFGNCLVRILSALGVALFASSLCACVSLVRRVAIEVWAHGKGGGHLITPYLFNVSSCLPMMWVPIPLFGFVFWIAYTGSRGDRDYRKHLLVGGSCFVLGCATLVVAGMVAGVYWPLTPAEDPNPALGWCGSLALLSSAFVLCVTDRATPPTTASPP